MTSKEMREYEEGKAYGYSHPAKVHGWMKSVAWNNGMKAGQTQYWEDWRKKEARLKAYFESRRAWGDDV